MKKLLLLLLLPFTLLAQGPSPCTPILININLDQYPSETTWDIKDAYGSTVLSGGPYDSVPIYQPQMIMNCLPVGQFTFTIYDQYGDGLQGSLWGGNDGSYYVIQCGDTLVYGDVPNFGTDSTHMLMSDTCIPPPPIPGCMDENYLEFDPAATADDGSCATLKIYGCTDSTMFNYDPLANHLDFVDSCNYTLILKDLLGNAWIGSYLEIRQGDTAYQFQMDSLGPEQHFDIMLNAPAPFEVEFFVVQQASGTTIECGFEIINPIGNTVVGVPPTQLDAFVAYPGFAYCGDGCEPYINGCLDSLAFNYNLIANTSDTSCYYLPGCTSPAYSAYHIDTTMGIYRDFHDQDSCLVSGFAIFGCTDFLAFNYDPTADVNVGCIPVVAGCMDAFAFNYNANANTQDTCIQIMYGCMSNIALNYDSTANTDDGSCIGIVLGCTDTAAFNWNPTANVDNGECVPVIYGCINITQFNYDSLANTNDGTCIPFIYGCTDSTMFNYNPLANADNSSCTPFVYGCTDPSMLNYSPVSNSEDFSCIPYIYGCTDAIALNYDSAANTNNGSCIEIIEGCMDQLAYNYNFNANVSDSVSCLFAASCSTGPGNPYWLNDECYAWVISIDDYCCENTWDEVCQSTYNYCTNSWTGPVLSRRLNDNLIIYPNPTKHKININKIVDVNVYNILGDMIISKQNINVLDVVKLTPGTYHLQIKYNNKTINKRIIKK
mgnify:CR=1 FL=1